MNASERAKISRAIDCVMDRNGGEYFEGLEILCRLIGRPPNRPDIKPTTVREVILSQSIKEPTDERDEEAG